CRLSRLKISPCSQECLLVAGLMTICPQRSVSNLKGKSLNNGLSQMSCQFITASGNSGRELPRRSSTHRISSIEIAQSSLFSNCSSQPLSSALRSFLLGQSVHSLTVRRSSVDKARRAPLSFHCKADVTIV